MSWAKLLADHRVTRVPPSKAELDNLRSIVTRSLKDVTAAGLSADARFIMAYDAGRTLSLIIVRAAGYRPRSVGARMRIETSLILNFRHVTGGSAAYFHLPVSSPAV
ncbi:MAG: hypothetical protein ABR964_01625 [Tepidisphaeraceae bacterium]|jgi:hypothetical protein